MKYKTDHAFLQDSRQSNVRSYDAKSKAILKNKQKYTQQQATRGDKN